MKFYLDPEHEGTRRKHDAKTGPTFLGHGWYWAHRSSGDSRRHRGNDCWGPFDSEALAVADARKRHVEARERADRAAVRDLVKSDAETTKGGKR